MSEMIPVPPLRRYPELDGRTFLLGVGGMKCATSWVFQYVQSLDGVAATPIKELHFFNARLRPKGHQPFTPRLAGLVRDYVDLAPDAAAEIAVNPHFQGAVDCLSMLYDDNAYFGHFARQCGPDTRLLSEITPQYAMLGRDGFDYVRRFFASQNMDLKILMVLRDPVQRLWSHLHFLKQTEPELDITRDWPDLIRRRAVIERSDYWQTIEALDAIFPDDAVLYLFYEDLFQGDALERLCAYLGLDHAPPDPQRRNETPDKSALPPDVRDRLTRVLNPQYRFCRDRFGAAIPKKWAA